MNKRVRNIILAFLPLVFILGSCSATKHLPEGEVLYTGIRQVKYRKTGENSKDWKVNDFAEKSKDVIMDVWVAPNGAFFGVPFLRLIPVRLTFYNWFYTEKEKGFSRWIMENFGEPPVSISSVRPELRTKAIENTLFNMGHFGVKAGYKIKYRGSKKGFIKYSVYLPEAYTYGKIEVKLDSVQEVLRAPLSKYMENSKIIPGKDFNLDELELEKKLLWEFLQNNGYFYLQKDNIIIFADSTAGGKHVDLQYRIDKDLSPTRFRKVYISEDSVSIDNVVFKKSENTVVSRSGKKINKELLDGIIRINKNSLYSLENTKKTIRNLAGTGIFTEPIIKYIPEKGDSLKLAADINLSTVDMFSIGLNGNLIQKNTGFIGPGIGITTTEKNIFGSAENLSISLDGYLDFPYGLLKSKTTRSSGISSNATLSTPVINSPLKFIAKHDISIPKRNISLGFELNKRADFFNISEWKSSYGLVWFSSPKISHELNILNLNYSNLKNTTPAFDTLFLQSAQIRNSFRNEFIAGSSYTFTYNNTGEEYKRFTTYFRADVDLAGNLLNGAFLLAGKKGEDKKFLGVGFNQYLRLTTDFRAYLNIGDRGSQLAFRNQIGLGKAFGNSSSMPYVKQFYIGGNNSLRPLTARVVGPGRYLEFDESSLNQVGDIKFESNIEYRFKIAYILYGALWADIGNIWLWKEDPERPRSNIRFNKIIADSYFTSGVGLRVDLDYLIIRADYGALLYMPILITGKRWIWDNKLPLYDFVFGIGYPF